MLEERRFYAENIIESKGKEMSKLITGFKEAEDNKAAKMKEVADIDARVGELQDQQFRILAECEASDEVMDHKAAKMKEVTDIDARLREMQTIRADLLTECEAKDQVMNKLLKKRKKLEKFITSQINKERSETSRLEKEFSDLKLKNLKQSEEKIYILDEDKLLAKVKTMKTPNLELLEYIDHQIEVKERELECPICLEMASVPIFMCDELHLICSSYRPKVGCLPTLAFNCSKWLPV